MHIEKTSCATDHGLAAHKFSLMMTCIVIKYNHKKP